ncbi:Zinc finger protein 64-like protein, isoforms 1 and 2, partial [Bos mutus]
VPGGTTVLVELTPDIHICGICKQQFNNLDAFVAHKQSGCQLTGTSGAAPSTVQFVSEETVPATQTQTTTRTITSETQTITVSAPEFVFEHGYQTYLPTESNENQTATVISLPAKSRAKKPTAPPAQKRLNCCYPGCQFKTAYGMKDMERHLKIHTGDKPHKCEVCGKCFSRKDKLKTHTRCHTGVKPYKCKSCDYAAADSSSLNKHLRIHSDERPFKCQLCPYASRNSSQLTVHLRSPPGDAPFQCWLCSAKFKISSDLKRHMRVHSGEKPFKCEFCSVRCTMKGNLKSHIRIKHSGNSFKCPHCDFLGDSKATLRKHSRLHQAEHPEKCPDCSYSCPSKAALRVHSRVHCPDRPFKCSHCSFDTKQPSNLAKHVKKFHGDALKSEAAERRDVGRAAAPAVNSVQPPLVAPNPEELRGNSRLQILRQVNLIAPPPPSGCSSEAAALPQPAVLLTTHDQTEGATLHQTLIPTTPGGPQEGSGNQTFITSSGITCTDFEGLNALIQEGAAEVTVVSDGGQSIAVATTAPPIFSTSQQELPKQTYSIIQGGAHPALLCPADSIPD